MAAHAPWNEAQAHEIIAAGADRQGGMLPILHALQAVFGCIPGQAVPLVAHALNLTRAEVHGVVTFYHDFRREPPGRHTLRLCRAEACQAVGADALADHVQRRLAISWHQTTPDGALTLEPVFCLGLCANGPAALLDGEPMGCLDEARIARALEHLT